MQQEIHFRTPLPFIVITSLPHSAEVIINMLALPHVHHANSLSCNVFDYMCGFYNIDTWLSSLDPRITNRDIHSIE